VACRYGEDYVLHSLQAVAAIMQTREYADFADRVLASHDKANQQYAMDVSPAMGEMLAEMQACLKQLSGNSLCGDPEAVARLIAAKFTAMIVVVPEQTSSADLVLALPALPTAAAAAPCLPSDAKRLRGQLIQSPILYDTSGSISTVELAWREWKAAGKTIAERLIDIKADKSLAVGRRNASLHKKNRHLPEMIESLINLGAPEDAAVNLVSQIARQLQLSLQQMREGARLVQSNKTAKSDDDTLTAETLVTLGQFRMFVAKAYQLTQMNVSSL